MRPEISPTKVVLPAPFGPMSARISPAASWKSTERTAWTPPKLLLSPRVVSNGVTAATAARAA